MSVLAGACGIPFEANRVKKSTAHKSFKLLYWMLFSNFILKSENLSKTNGIYPVKRDIKGRN